MIIKMDRSDMSAGTRELIERGYAREELDKLVFRFEYTEEERIQNREMAVKLSSEVWAASADRAARRRSEMMEPVMKSIAGEFVCYQYDHEEKLALRSTKWDLFFHCNALNVLNASAAGRDYSYFTLSFNREHTVEQRMEICGRVIRLLQERFAAHPNLHISVQYMGLLDTEKIRRFIQRALPSMDGKRCSYHGWEGRLVLVEDSIFFMKKRAKTRGYRLTPDEALLISLKGAA